MLSRYRPSKSSTTSFFERISAKASGYWAFQSLMVLCGILSFTETASTDSPVTNIAIAVATILGE